MQMPRCNLGMLVANTFVKPWEALGGDGDEVDEGDDGDEGG